MSLLLKLISSILFIVLITAIILILFTLGYKVRQFEGDTLYDRTYDWEMCTQSCEKVESMNWDGQKFICSCVVKGK